MTYRPKLSDEPEADIKDATTERRTYALPVWLRALIGVLSVGFGVILAVHPFASVALMLFILGVGLVVAGVAEVARRQEVTEPRSRLQRWFRPLFSALFIMAGLLVLFWPALGLRLTVLMVGVMLVMDGARNLILGATGTEHRLANVLGGAASVIFGLLALTWRDVTVLALGLIFGIWLAVQGARLVLDAMGDLRERDRLHTRRDGGRVIVGALSLALAVVLAFLGGLGGTPQPDAFYLPPPQVPDATGVLLRAEPFERAVPEGAHAWRILYTTTRADEVHAIASALVVVPDTPGPVPVIAWTHGTTGVAVGCAPTLLPDPLASGAMPDPAAVIDAGWAIVATDYIGLGADPPHAYLIGEEAARATLDAIRAAHQLGGILLANQVAVWGHSQGGGAALWTGGLAQHYAPEIDIVGVAALAPAANLPAMVSELANSKAGTLVGPLVLAGFSERYDDVRVSDYLRPEATLLYEATITRCWSDPAMLVNLVQAAVIDRVIWARSPNEGPLAPLLEQNVPRLPIRAPLLIAQGLADTLVLPGAQLEYVNSLCASGQYLDYRTFDGEDHVSVVGLDSPVPGELMGWTRDRFNGVPVVNACP